MFFDEQLSRGFVLLPRLLDAAETAAPGEVAEAVLAHTDKRTPEGVADATT
ncbi:hypothetical protein ACF07S_22085 [Streptomyces sp. NPDC016640]|uniref:hypothetical protein n=1 Tax=Streptomyces sp. NPDC016640 TaxID=3364969 RepID=UPI003702A69C